jgi:hypothetical protein
MGSRSGGLRLILGSVISDSYTSSYQKAGICALNLLSYVIRTQIYRAFTAKRNEGFVENKSELLFRVTRSVLREAECGGRASGWVQGLLRRVQDGRRWACADMPKLLDSGGAPPRS